MPARGYSLALVLVPFAIASASAEVKSAGPSGFEVLSAATIAAPPERVYAALGEIGRWWSSSHTFSKEANNLSLELHAGG
jgi:hypothetical protein